MLDFFGNAISQGDVVAYVKASRFVLATVHSIGDEDCVIVPSQGKRKGLLSKRGVELVVGHSSLPRDAGMPLDENEGQAPPEAGLSFVASDEEGYEVR